jgi:CRISPR/Cas system CSM-associated protein Csm4 (group 5 of RAMP superfamily)
MLAHRDIVDTEPSSGDVYKMLLGSFIPEYDYADKDADSWSLSTERLPVFGPSGN